MTRCKIMIVTFCVGQRFCSAFTLSIRGQSESDIPINSLEIFYYRILGQDERRGTNIYSVLGIKSYARDGNDRRISSLIF